MNKYLMVVLRILDFILLAFCWMRFFSSQSLGDRIFWAVAMIPSYLFILGFSGYLYRKKKPNLNPEFKEAVWSKCSNCGKTYSLFDKNIWCDTCGTKIERVLH